MKKIQQWRRHGWGQESDGHTGIQKLKLFSSIFVKKTEVFLYLSFVISELPQKSKFFANDLFSVGIWKKSSQNRYKLGYCATLLKV